jgi:glycosyltransferase involved in cell wall biosynthesis
LVSVCVPTRNHAAYLEDAIRSVLVQTLPDFEIVVFDDGSTDRTPDILERFDDRRIRTFRHDRSSGVAATRNRCLRVARGRYLAWLDSDDIYEPGMLEQQVRILEQMPSVGLVHGGFSVIDRAGSRLPPWPEAFSEDTIEAGREAFAELILSNYITAPTVVVRREIVDRVGPYAVHIGPSSTDWEMWLRISLVSDLAYRARPVARYRQHPDSISARTTPTGDRLLSDIRVVESVFRDQRDRLPDPARTRNRAFAALRAKAVIAAGEAFTRNDLGAARHAVQAAMRLDPEFEREAGPGLLTSIANEDEYANFQCSREALSCACGVLEPSRFARQLRKLITVDPSWQETLEEAARRVRRFVPDDGSVVAVDKWDPTLLMLAQRSGRHFPDRSLFPDGYPPDSASAVDHLNQLVGRGASYIVFPSFAYWWLEHYPGLRAELETRWSTLSSDEHCIIYARRPADATLSGTGAHA